MGSPSCVDGGKLRERGKRGEVKVGSGKHLTSISKHISSLG
jgi:hypothetical protein